MIDIIDNFFKRHDIDRNSKILVGLSGGADSIVLIHTLKYMNINMVAAHCNFSLRGKESDMDENFVKRFCSEYGIELKVKKFNTIEYSKERGISIEMAARDLRYNWFADLKEKKGLDYIMVAHHADDSAETIFINITRGTGIRGLTGIKDVNENILRPFLKISKNEIIEYANKHHIGFRTDSTNNSDDYTRNKIRNHIIPILKEINPSLLETMDNMSKILRESELIFNYGINKISEEVVNKKDDEIFINIEKTLNTPAPFTFLYEYLKNYGFNKYQVKSILESSTSIPGKFFKSETHTLTKGRVNWIIYENIEDKFENIFIDKEGSYKIGKDTINIERFKRTEDFKISKDAKIVTLDADKIEFPIQIRRWKKGDYFCPIGMKRSKKKLSDFFVDMKFNTKQKQESLVLLSNNDIAWIIGLRPDDRFKINRYTENIIQITLSQSME